MIKKEAQFYKKEARYFERLRRVEHSALPITFYARFTRRVFLLPLQPSTNGTWFRLSGMHTESRPYPLSNGSEILIGTVREEAA